MMFTVAWGVLTEPLLGLRPLVVASRPLQLCALVILLACGLSKNRRLHAAAAVAMLVILVTLVFVVRQRTQDLLVD
jgi:hypothetical protein